MPDEPLTSEWKAQQIRIGQAITTISGFTSNGWVVKAIRLTDAQREDLRDYTGQATTLLGYPVK